jgi:hypothetical protein
MVKYMGTKSVKQYLFNFALVFILCTCNDPVFYSISKEVKPKEPLIKGVPTNFAFYDGRMFIASGNTLYTYNKGTEQNNAYWDKETPPGGNILQIASTGNYLYALCSTDQNNDGKTVIKRFDKESSSWPEISGIANDTSKINNIFAAGGMLFITAAASASNYYNIYYCIFFIDDSQTINELEVTDTEKNNIGEVNGAAFNGESYFLSTKNDGVYKIDDFSAGAYPIKYKDANDKELNINLSGIINLQDNNSTIFLIARNGDAYTVKDSIVKIENVSMGKMTTGALAIWQKPDDPSERLLLSGRQDSLSYSYTYGYTYGYLELELDTNGIKSGKNFVEPGKELLSTVEPDGNERFQSTIGKHPVNYLFQVPSEIDSDMILFAATQKNGVWSYRDRGKDGFQWNAEE